MFRLALRGAALACTVAGMCHALLGVRGDWIVGITPASPVDPSLDSQNRFYGAAFLVFGILLWMSAANIKRYAPVLRALFGVTFLAGCARALALFAYGWPTPQILFFWSTELIVPPLLWVWLERELRRSSL
jgi:hypothetical protein